MIAAHDGRIACLVQEVEAGEPPAPGFLAGLRDLCDRHGIVLIFDEIITGFRWHPARRVARARRPGRPDHLRQGARHGFAVAALVGRPDIMALGGLLTERERVFLLSTTYGADTHTLAATMAVLDVYEQEPVIEHLHRQGRRLADGVRAAAAAHGVADFVGVAGRDSNLIYLTRDGHGERSQPFRTLFLQEMIRRGVIAPSFVVSYSHTDADIDRTIEAVDGTLASTPRPSATASRPTSSAVP